jgi:hypothetical protein
MEIPPMVPGWIFVALGLALLVGKFILWRREERAANLKRINDSRENLARQMRYGSQVISDIFDYREETGVAFTIKRQGLTDEEYIAKVIEAAARAGAKQALAVLRRNIGSGAFPQRSEFGAVGRITVQGGRNGMDGFNIETSTDFYNAGREGGTSSE